MKLAKSYLSTLIVVIVYIGAARGYCSPDHDTKCCLGYFLDAFSNECKECPPGYIGLNCSIKCRYPAYGRSCQRQCNCSEEFCDITTGCADKRYDTPQTGESNANEKTPPETNHAGSRQTSKNSNEKTHATPILIGVVVALAFILLAIGGRCIWKKVKQANPRSTPIQNEIRSLEVELNRITHYEDMKENHYEDLDEQKACESKKEGQFSSETDYIDTLAFAKRENKSEDRESKHFYDALK